MKGTFPCPRCQKPLKYDGKDVACKCDANEAFGNATFTLAASVARVAYNEGIAVTLDCECGQPVTTTEGVGACGCGRCYGVTIAPTYPPDPPAEAPPE